MKQVVRRSPNGDTIYLDFLDDDNKIISTPFYISNGQSIEVHWGTPSNERCDNPMEYDDFFDRFLFKMENGDLYSEWLNGPSWISKKFSRVTGDDLIEWGFQYARKIITNE